MFGEKFKLENDDEILKINSPKELLKGPYMVVYKSIEDKWVIVALRWEGKPSLGIRWFWKKSGTPSSRGYATWLIIPSMLHNAVLNGLPLEFKIRDKINRFLAGKITGMQLRKEVTL
jgi:hypothetical protein